MFSPVNALLIVSWTLPVSDARFNCARLVWPILLGSVEAMEKFIVQPDLIVTMGIEGRRMAEEKFDVKKVNQEIFKMIEII